MERGLDEHGHRGTRDQQTDHGEQHGSGGTGERQLGDVLDVGDLEGALVVLGQVPGILTSEGGSSICGCTGSDRELANERCRCSQPGPSSQSRCRWC